MIGHVKSFQTLLAHGRLVMQLLESVTHAAEIPADADSRWPKHGSESCLMHDMWCCKLFCEAAETMMKLMKSNGIEANVVTYTATRQEPPATKFWNSCWHRLSCVAKNVGVREVSGHACTPRPS